MPVKRELDPEKVARVKERFDSNTKFRTTTATFEDWLELFQDDCKNFRSIAQKVGCTTANVSLVFKNYFVDLLPGRSGGWKRVHICKLKQRKINLQQTPTEELTAKIAEAATSHGLRVEQVARRNRNRQEKVVCKKRLRINKKLCIIRRITKCKKAKNGSGPCYGRFTLTQKALEEVRFTILLHEISESRAKIYVFPSKELLVYTETEEVRHLYIPLEERTHKQNNYHRVFDATPFLDAWHLLK